MKIAICENNHSDMESISNHIKRYCADNRFMVDIHMFKNAESMLEAYPSEKYSIIVLDIIMEGLTGMDAARRIREIDSLCQIIFITSSKDYSLDAYSVDGTAYVLKPVNREKIYKAMDKCRSQLIESSRYITVNTKDLGTINIRLANIYYAEVFDKIVYIYIGNSKIATSKLTLSQLEEECGGEPFLRCHRSYIINMSKVESLSKGQFKMKNGDTVFFPKRAYSEIQLTFGKYISNKLKEDA